MSAKNWLGFEFKIGISFVLVFLVVGGLIFIAFSGLRQTVNSIEQVDMQDTRLLLLKELMYDMAEADTRAYTTAYSGQDTSMYLQAVARIDRKLDSLGQLMQNDPTWAASLASLQDLAVDKYENLFDLIALREDTASYAVIDQMMTDILRLDAQYRRMLAERDRFVKRFVQDTATKSNNINTLPTEEEVRAKVESEAQAQVAQEQEERSQQEKSGILGRIFGRKKRQREQEAFRQQRVQEVKDSLLLLQDTVVYVPSLEPVVVSAPQPRLQMARVLQQRLEQLEQTERERLQNRRQLAQTLRQEAQAVTNQIRQLTNALEARLINEAQQRANQVNLITKRTRNSITIIAIGALLLFFVLLLRIFADIARSNNNRKELEAAKQKAEKLAHAKEDFLSSMSHEIRTPMTAIIGFTEQVLQSPLPSTQKEHLTIVQRSADHLLGLINDILDFSKLKSGKVPLEKTGFRPTTELQQVVTLLAGKAKEKGLDLHIENELPQDLILVGDPLRFRQIFINLLSNALKFTAQGSVTIGLKQVAPTQTRKKAPNTPPTLNLQLWVQDTGIGIPAKKLKNIFKDFHQVHKDPTGLLGGTGLGLSIVKKLVDQHKGQIQVQSQPNQGSTFTVQLPYGIGQPADLPAEGHLAIEDTAWLNGMHVLVVDDEAFNRSLVQLILQKWGCYVSTAANGKEALAQLSRYPIQAVLTDIQMPVMDGHALVRQMRRHEVFAERHIPVIATSAASMKNAAEASLRSGMDAYLLKPFTEQQVYAVLKKHLPGSIVPPATPVLNPDGQAAPAPAIKENKTPVAAPLNGQPHSTAKATTATSSHAQSAAFDLSALQATAAGNQEFVVNMVNLFLRNARADWQEVQQALKHNQTEQIALLAHKMAAPSRHLGLTQLVKNLKALEAAARGQQDAAQLQALANTTNDLLQQSLQALQNYLQQETAAST